MMTSSQISKLLNEIETDYDVENLRYHGYDLWPSLKILLLKTHIAKNTTVKKAIKAKKRYFLKFLHTIATFIRLYMLKLKKIDIFYINYEHHLYQSEGKVFNKFYKQLKIDLKCSFQDFFYLYDNSQLNLNIALNGIKITSKNQRKEAIDVENDPGMIAFHNYIKTNYPQFIKADFDLFYHLGNHLSIIFDAHKTWCTILKNNSPKIILTVCYYTPQNFGLIWAANQVNIPVLEIQHGNQTNYPPYNFKKIPAKAYNSLPSHFLTWDDSSCRNLNKWVTKTNKIKAFVLGNPWMTYLSDSRNPLYKSSMALIAKSFDVSKPIILYTMVPELGILPEVIGPLVKQTQHDYQWLFRMHPRQGISIETAKMFLIENGLTEVEVKVATKLPLPIVMQIANLHITSWSSAVLEASQFAVKSLLFHEEGKTRYGGHLKNIIYSDPDFFTDSLKFRLVVDDILKAGKQGVQKIGLNKEPIKLLLK